MISEPGGESVLPLGHHHSVYNTINYSKHMSLSLGPREQFDIYGTKNARTML